MQTIREALIGIITARPINNILAKASADWLFFSFYILIMGLALMGLINLSLKINGKSRKTIIIASIIILSLTIAAVIISNVLFSIIRSQ